VGEVEDIFARMTRAELELYRALGGQLTAGQQRRLLGKTMELLAWYQPPTSPGTRQPGRSGTWSVASAGPPGALPGSGEDGGGASPSAGPSDPRPWPIPKSPGPQGVPIECVENPKIRFPNLTVAAQELGVSTARLSKAVAFGCEGQGPALAQAGSTGGGGMKGDLERSKLKALGALVEYSEALRCRIVQIDAAIREISGRRPATATTPGRRAAAAATIGPPTGGRAAPPPHTTATAGPPAPASPRLP
jgi:hypothetical protein